jgi:hypothetical protein
MARQSDEPFSLVEYLPEPLQGVPLALLRFCIFAANSKVVALQDLHFTLRTSASPVVYVPHQADD